MVNIALSTNGSKLCSFFVKSVVGPHDIWKQWQNLITFWCRITKKIHGECHIFNQSEQSCLEMLTFFTNVNQILHPWWLCGFWRPLLRNHFRKQACKKNLAFWKTLLNVNKSFFNINIIKIWFPNGFLHRHTYLEGYAVPYWLTLFMGVGSKWPQILTLYMLGWKGLVLGIPKMYHMLM